MCVQKHFYTLYSEDPKVTRKQKRDDMAALISATPLSGNPMGRIMAQMRNLIRGRSIGY